jgi:O-antigen/teichoic acid export membrane protein
VSVSGFLVRLSPVWGLGEQLKRLQTPEIRSLILSLGPTIGQLLLQLVTFIILGRGLGAASFGQYAALTAITAVLVEVIGCGAGDILVRGIILRPEQFARYFGNALILMILTLPFTLLGGSLLALDVVHVEAEHVAIVLFIFGELMAGRLTAHGDMMSNAKRHFIGASLMRIAPVLPRFFLAIGVFLLYPHTTLSTWLMECSVQATLVALFAYAYLIRRYGAPHWRFVSRAEFGVGLLFNVAQTARAAQGNIDRAFLAAFSLGSIVGSYAAASRVTQLGLFPIQVANRVLYPKFFASGAKGIAAGRRFALKCAPLLFGIGILSGGSVALVGCLIPSLLGRDFIAARPFALALATAVPLMAIQYPAADALTGSGKQALRTLIYVMTACTFGILLVIGAILGGPKGLTAAFVLGQGAIAALLWIMLFLQKDDAAPV